MNQAREYLLKFLLLLLAFTVPFVVYLATLSPGVTPGDSTEMVTAAVVLGVPHQPSYPVNTLLGHLASKLPVSLPVVARVNAVSAFLQALTVGVFYLLVVELFTYANEASNENSANIDEKGKPIRMNSQKSDSYSIRIPAFTASMFLAFSLIFWQYATKFEVFPLNNLLATLLLLLTVKIASSKRHLRGDRNSHLGGEDRLDVRLPVLALLAGFAFTHHQTILFVFPALILLLWRQALQPRGLLARRGRSQPSLKLRPAGLSIGISLAGFLTGMVPFFGLLLWTASRNPPLNWGDVTDLSGAFAALTRRDFGTFSSFLVGNQPVVRQAPLAQIPFYLRWLVFDFSAVGILLILVGVWHLWKTNRRLFWFTASGWGISGIAFLMYANFPLSDSFNQATVRRFHILPNLFVALFLAFGLRYLFEILCTITTRDRANKFGILLGKLLLVGAFLFPLGMNFSKADHRGSTLTEAYAWQAYSATEENALILLSGDIPNMTADYYRDVELGGSGSRIIFTPGQFHLPWFTPQLQRRYPDLVIPQPMPGKQFTTATQIIEANWGKWPMYVGPDLVVNDPELEEKFVLYPRNLLFLVKQKGEDLQLEDWRAENDALWQGIDLTQIRRAKRDMPKFEETIVFHYARHFHNSGFVYEEVGLYDDAIREYKRVLEIDPAFKDSLAALGRIYGEKLEQPDFVTAVEYLNRYISVLTKGEEDYAYAAASKIQEYQEKFAQLMEESAPESTQSAVPSEEATPASGEQ